MRAWSEVFRIYLSIRPSSPVYESGTCRKDDISTEWSVQYLYWAPTTLNYFGSLSYFQHPVGK